MRFPKFKKIKIYPPSSVADKSSQLLDSLIIRDKMRIRKECCAFDQRLVSLLFSSSFSSFSLAFSLHFLLFIPRIQNTPTQTQQ